MTTQDGPLKLAPGPHEITVRPKSKKVMVLPGEIRTADFSRTTAEQEPQAAGLAASSSPTPKQSEDVPGDQEEISLEMVIADLGESTKSNATHDNAPVSAVVRSTGATVSVEVKW